MLLLVFIYCLICLPKIKGNYYLRSEKQNLSLIILTLLAIYVSSCCLFCRY